MPLLQLHVEVQDLLWCPVQVSDTWSSSQLVCTCIYDQCVL